MAKQKKNNHSDIQPVPREAIAAVGCEEDFVELLRRELEWPIPMTVQRLADVAIPHDPKKISASSRRRTESLSRAF